MSPSSSLSTFFESLRKDVYNRLQRYVQNKALSELPKLTTPIDLDRISNCTGAARTQVA